MDKIAMEKVAMYKEAIYKEANIKSKILQMGKGVKDKLSSIGSGIKEGFTTFYRSRPVQNVARSMEAGATAGAAKGALKGGFSGGYQGLKSALGFTGSGSYKPSNPNTPYAVALGLTGLAGAGAYKKGKRYESKAKEYEAKQNRISKEYSDKMDYKTRAMLADILENKNIPHKTKKVAPQILNNKEASEYLCEFYKEAIYKEAVAGAVAGFAARQLPTFTRWGKNIATGAKNVASKVMPRAKVNQIDQIKKINIASTIKPEDSGLVQNVTKKPWLTRTKVGLGGLGLGYAGGSIMSGNNQNQNQNQY